jgi:hypothetical protein
MRKKPRPHRVGHLPDIVLDELEKLSQGDWRRVTLGPGGDAVVHNRPQVFRVELEPQGTTAKKLSERGRHHASRRPVADRVLTVSQQSTAPADFAPPSASPRRSVPLPPATPQFTAPDGARPGPVGARSTVRGAP